MADKRLPVVRALCDWWYDTGFAAVAVSLVAIVCLSTFLVQLGCVASGPAASVAEYSATAQSTGDSPFTTDHTPAPGYASRAVPGFSFLPLAN